MHIVHLSDLHLLMEDTEEQGRILDALVAALGRHRQRSGPVDLLALTGDVFDSSTVHVDVATRTFRTLHRHMRDALGGEVPTVIVPGNHDRRRAGLMGPHRNELFDALRADSHGRTWVHGASFPFLADVVPPELHGLPAWVIAYDSTFLTRGLFSAGGMIRQEDLLHAASAIDGRHPEWPVILLMHHHLVSTPLTDLGRVETGHTPALVQLAVHHVLPWLVAHADREELTMTALGAGTALSTLHSMGRAVLVLHGHKHYATARVLDATWDNQGDVALVSAGSGGVAQTWLHGGVQPAARRTARLWPSFNVVQLDAARLVVDTVSFGWKGSSRGKLTDRPLLRASRDGSQWKQEPIPSAEMSGREPPRLARNEARYRLSPARDGRLWDYDCERMVVPLARGPRRYLESVEGLGPIELRLDGPTRYQVSGGATRTLPSQLLDGAPYGWLGLMNRYASEEAAVTIEGLGPDVAAFASATDLGTGLEHPLRVERRPDGVIRASYRACPARALIRVYWPLASA